MSAARFPTLFIPHGAGPCFFMDWKPAGTWDAMETWLRGLEQHAGARPRALLLVSAHWEAPLFTVNSAPRPGLLYDYYGFPESTYRIDWPAHGSRALADRIRRLLEARGIGCAEDTGRGLDHGVFIPMRLAFPQADVPVVQLSLRRDLDSAAHLAMGRALAPLREQEVLIVGSGMSYHNMRRFRRDGGPADPDSVRFDRWLTETLSMPGKERNARLVRWSDAPGARSAHPREEHLLPLHVVAGAADNDPGEQLLSDQVLGSVQSAFRFGCPVSS